MYQQASAPPPPYEETEGESYPVPVNQNAGYNAPQGGYTAAPSGYAPPPQGGYAPPPSNYQPTSGPYTDNPEQPFAKADDSGGFQFGFSEAQIRRGFIRKVYSILIVQLAITLMFIALFLYVDAIRIYSRNNPWLWGVAFVLTFICLIALACCPDVRRKSPTNYIFLGIFTVCEGFLLGSVSSCYEAGEVMMAVGITAVVCLGLTIFAFQTKYDFTMCSGALLVLLICLLCFGILSIIIRSQILSIVYASLGALVFSLYLVFDTQMMMGGKHKYSLSPEEYIFAALNLYLDIINMFLFILTIIGAARG